MNIPIQNHFYCFGVQVLNVEGSRERILYAYEMAIPPHPATTAAADGDHFAWSRDVVELESLWIRRRKSLEVFRAGGWIRLFLCY